MGTRRSPLPDRRRDRGLTRYRVRMGSHYIAGWRIDIERREGVARLAPDAVLARAVAASLEAAGAPSPASIGLILSDDAELAELNAAHMSKDGPTDVLSFPLLAPEAFPDHAGKGSSAGDTAAGGAGEGSWAVKASAGGAAGFALPPGARPHLGDIVVSVERAADQAEAGRGGQTGDVAWDARDEVRLLVTHGTLHVCGWDHAQTAEESAMRALEQELLGRRS
jgi:probable rRNA maturation factor